MEQVLWEQDQLPVVAVDWEMSAFVQVVLHPLLVAKLIASFVHHGKVLAEARNAPALSVVILSRIREVFPVRKKNVRSVKPRCEVLFVCRNLKIGI